MSPGLIYHRKKCQEGLQRGLYARELIFINGIEKAPRNKLLAALIKTLFAFTVLLIKRQRFIMNGIFWRRLKWEVFFFCLYINWQTTKWGGGGACEWGAIRAGQSTVTQIQEYSQPLHLKSGSKIRMRTQDYRRKKRQIRTMNS